MKKTPKMIISYCKMTEDLLAKVPNRLRDEASKFMEMFYKCHQLGFISQDQFFVLANEFVVQLDWFSKDVPEERTRECCEETYADVTLKAHLDKKISFRQFAFIRRRNLRLFGKRYWEIEKNSKDNNSLL